MGLVIIQIIVNELDISIYFESIKKNLPSINLDILKFIKLYKKTINK